MNKLEVSKAFECLKNKTLTKIEFCDKINDKEDSFITLTFSGSYKLVVQTFWRMFDDSNVLAMDTERYLLPDNTAPEKDYQDLPFNKSLLCKNIDIVNEKYMNTVVKEISINDIFDLNIEFENNLIVQALINCRCHNYNYYEFKQENKVIVKVTFNWSAM